MVLAVQIAEACESAFVEFARTDQVTLHSKDNGEVHPGCVGIRVIGASRLLQSQDGPLAKLSRARQVTSEASIVDQVRCRQQRITMVLADQAVIAVEDHLTLPAGVVVLADPPQRQAEFGAHEQPRYNSGPLPISERVIDLPDQVERLFVPAQSA